MLGRLQGAWRELDRDQRLAGLAALALLVTLFLPWYQAPVVEAGKATTPSFTAFGVFSFVEAAIFLVALGVFVLLFARGERRGFHLPGGDGTVIFAAGLWGAVLLMWRVFDRPDVERAIEVGITWGFFFAFIAAAALAATGWRIRVAGRPEPPILRAGEPPEPIDERTAATRVEPRRRRPQSRRRVEAAEQLTLDDAAPEEPPARHPSDAPPTRRVADDPPTRRVAEDDPPTRRVPEPPGWEDPPREPAPPAPFRGVFDQAADEPTRRVPREERAPLRPGEIPPASDS